MIVLWTYSSFYAKRRSNGDDGRQRLPDRTVARRVALLAGRKAAAAGPREREKRNGIIIDETITAICASARNGHNRRPKS